MGGMICKQPNGKYCRFSSIVDAPTHINMTEENYMEVCAERAKAEAKDTIENYLYPFDEMLKRCRVKDTDECGNMTRDEFEEIIKACNDPNGKFEIL